MRIAEQNDIDPICLHCNKVMAFADYVTWADRIGIGNLPWIV